MSEHKVKLEPISELFIFKDMTKWQKFKLWLQADVPYFFMNLWWKITKKY